MIKEIHLKDFRNYREVHLPFNEEINIFCGRNGEGKTNLLEAVYFLATLSSFRKTKASRMVREGESSFSIAGSFEGIDTGTLSIEKSQNQWRKISADGIDYKKKLDYIGKVCIVVFSPDEMELIQGSPEGRRRYLDRSYFNVNARHLKQIKNYRRILKQRNSLLKGKRINRPELDLWSEKLAHAGARVVKGRLEIIDLLNGKLENNHPFIGSDNVSLGYQDGADTNKSIEEIEKNILDTLLKLRKEEEFRKSTLAGPHRDGVDIYVNNALAKTFSSRGEMRSVLLALKTAEAEVYRSIRREPTLTLLDDVASELDIERRKSLLSFLRQRGEQVLITTTEPENIPFERSSKDSLFMVSNGKIEH